VRSVAALLCLLSAARCTVCGWLRPDYSKQQAARQSVG
jgi:hypothetical protein